MMERTPLRHYESQSMQFLMGLSQEAETACKTLAKRLEMTGTPRRCSALRKIRWKLQRIC